MNNDKFDSNTSAARIFLNAFGLTLKSIDKNNNNAKTRAIIDKDENTVGTLLYNNNKILIEANYNDSILTANYNIVKKNKYIGNSLDNIPFSDWINRINFQVQKANNKKISGELILSCSIDYEFGVTCRCLPRIKYEDSIQNITIKIINGTRLFELEKSSGTYNERIAISPNDDYNGYIKHIITNEKYKKSTGVFKAREEYEDKIETYLLERNCNTYLSHINKYYKKVTDKNSKYLTIQKGMLMRIIDSDMFQTIQETRTIFSIGDISILDNLISICYDKYTNQEIQALLGINRKKMNYQNGTDNLVNSYYEIEKNFNNLPIKEQKKQLIKRVFQN